MDDGPAYSIYDMNRGNKEKNITLFKVDMSILNADPVECFISCAYIARCKQWMIKNNFKEKWLEEYNRIKDKIKDCEDCGRPVDDCACNICSDCELHIEDCLCHVCGDCGNHHDDCECNFCSECGDRIEDYCPGCDQVEEEEEEE